MCLTEGQFGQSGGGEVVRFLAWKDITQLGI